MDEIQKNTDYGQKRSSVRVLFFKKKIIFAVLVAVVFAAVCVFGGMGLASMLAVSPADRVKVVIDAGHGGIDNGVVGVSGTRESEFNLNMSLLLAEYLEGAGFEPILTRKNSDGLYGDADGGFKRADMAERKRIITESDPDLVVSIHANKYPNDSRRGAQVFFDGLNSDGEALAGSIQSSLNLLNNKYVGRSFAALQGDYFILKCSRKPSVIVECGFLSNAEDEKLLCDAAYRKELAFAVYSGLVGFLSDSSAEM